MNFELWCVGLCTEVVMFWALTEKSGQKGEKSWNLCSCRIYLYLLQGFLQLQFTHKEGFVHSRRDPDENLEYWVVVVNEKGEKSGYICARLFLGS